MGLFKSRRQKLLEAEQTRLIEQLPKLKTLEAYQRTTIRIKDLDEILEHEYKRKRIFTPDALLGAGVTIGSVLLILHGDAVGNFMTSKASIFIPKIKI